MIIYDISPTETPFLSAIPKVKATGTKHEWQIDALAAVSATNFVIEGDDATTDAITATSRLYNYRAISDKVARITGTQEAVSKAGRKSEMAYQMKKRMKEIKKDVEAALLENNAWVVGNDTLASECAGMQAYIKTNIDKASDGTAAGGTGSDGYTDGTARALTEAMFDNALSLAWTNGGTPSLGIMNAFQKRKAGAFSGNATRIANDTNKVSNTVDIYIDPLGSEVRLVPCRQVPTDVVYFVDPEYAAFGVLRDFSTNDLAKTGDSERKQILVEYTLEVRNEKAMAGIYDLTTS